MGALNEKPLPGETITTYTNRWFNGVHHTWVEQLRKAGHVEFLVRALILNCTPAYHLNTAAVMLLNQNLVALLSSTREPQNVFLKVQAQLIELAGPQLPNTLPAQVYPKENANEVPTAASRTTAPLGPRHLPMEIEVDSQLSHLR
jgi:hypothetical protein